MKSKTELLNELNKLAWLYCQQRNLEYEHYLQGMYEGLVGLKNARPQVKMLIGYHKKWLQGAL